MNKYFWLDVVYQNIEGPYVLCPEGVSKFRPDACVIPRKCFWDNQIGVLGLNKQYLNLAANQFYKENNVF